VDAAIDSSDCLVISGKENRIMDALDLMAKLWPILVGFVVIVLTFGEVRSRISVLEDKVKTLFDLWNKRG
jgi:hypothetical protein